MLSTVSAFVKHSVRIGAAASRSFAFATRPLAFAQGRVNMGKNLTIDTINERVKVAKYAVRGELVLRAQHYELALREREREHHTSGGRDLPFDKVVYCNIGNPQQLTQPPLTYFRQILALCDYPQLLESEEVQKLFPADVIARARCIIDELPGKTTGAYTESKGLRCMREEVAHYIHARDGHPANIDHIYLTNGASAGVKMALNIMIRDEKDAVMVPIPQYPLYTATLAMLGGTFIPYYLNEEQGWSLSVEELQRAVDEAKAKGKISLTHHDAPTPALPPLSPLPSTHIQSQTCLPNLLMCIHLVVCVKLACMHLPSFYHRTALQ